MALALDIDSAARQLRIQGDPPDDLADYVAAAIAVIERHTGETMATTSAQYVAVTPPVWTIALPQVPVRSVGSVTNDLGQTWESTDVSVSENGVLRALSTPFRGEMTVTYTAGYGDAPPANYVLAGLIIVQHLWESRRGSMPLASSDLEGAYDPRLAYAIPNRAIELLGSEAPGGFA